MTHIQDKRKFPDDVRQHAEAILEGLQGDYRMALEHMPVYREMYGESYCRELEALLTPKGEA